MFSSLALNSYENFKYKELDELTVKAIVGILKLKINLKKIAKVNEEGKVVYDMCQAFEDYKEEESVKVKYWHSKQQLII